MCTGFEIAALLGAGTSAAGGIKALTADKPKPPMRRQEAKPPKADTRDRSNRRGPAYGTQTPSLLAGPSSTASNSLLGS